MPESWTVIGRVRSVNPRLREVRVDVLGGYGRAYSAMKWICFDRAPDAPLRCKVASVRGDEEVAIVALGSGLPREIVGNLRGARILAKPEEIPARAGQHWRLDELVGMAVVTARGESLGTVSEVYQGPANDAFAVSRPKGRWMLPAIPEVIETVDLEHRTIVVGDIGPFVVEV